MGTSFLAFSGGKDSTAMAYRMAELGEPFVLLHTPTGNELPEVAAHVEATAKALGAELAIPPNHSLAEWIEQYESLPNNRQRWCTRQIKIVPAIAWLKRHPGSTLLVGLRADEQERTGLYGEWATYRYPLREWGWGVREVWDYIDRLGVTVPKRTDCAVCYDQRLVEWFELWRDHPEQYAQGEAWEARTGHTFRSPSRDTWPAALAELRREFEGGRRPKDTRPKRTGQLPLFDDLEEVTRCRVCAA
jgi:PP-loop superfamily ATP-utilizing enzyme